MKLMDINGVYNGDSDGEREMGDELLVCCAFVVSIRRNCSGELRKLWPDLLMMTCR